MNSSNYYSNPEFVLFWYKNFHVSKFRISIFVGRKLVRKWDARLSPRSLICLNSQNNREFVNSSTAICSANTSRFTFFAYKINVCE